MESPDIADLSQQKKIAPPYVAYKTLKNFIDSLRVAMPGRIDRSVMHTMSGGAQSHVMHALRTMDLVSKQGIPTESFKELVAAEGPARQKALLAAIRTGYPFLFDGTIDLSTATGKQLLEHFDGVPLSPNTIRRAVAFFLAAGKDSGLTLSPYFNKIQSRSGTPIKRTSASNGNAVDRGDEADDKTEDDPHQHAAKRPQAGESLTINLKSGGALTVSASTSFFKMSAEDRVFVFDIIDKLQKYGIEA